MIAVFSEPQRAIELGRMFLARGAHARATCHQLCAAQAVAATDALWRAGRAHRRQACRANRNSGYGGKGGTAKTAIGGEQDGEETFEKASAGRNRQGTHFGAQFSSLSL